MSDPGRNQTNEDANEEKNIFFRNAQIQKLFSDFFYDRDRVKLAKDENTKDENKVNLAENNNPSSATTKFTTVMTHLN